jgi:hypothetical protein
LDDLKELTPKEIEDLKKTYDFLDDADLEIGFTREVFTQKYIQNIPEGGELSPYQSMKKIKGSRRNLPKSTKSITKVQKMKEAAAGEEMVESEMSGAQILTAQQIRVKNMMGKQTEEEAVQ